MTTLIPLSSQRPGTWAGGAIGEICIEPAGAVFPGGDYRLWVGTATIERAANYSYFPGAERLHVLLSGGGLALTFTQPDGSIEERVELRTGESLVFDGERPLHARPLAGPVTAFNLVYARGQQSRATFMTAGGLSNALTPLTPAGSAGPQIPNTPILHTRILYTRILYVVDGQVSVRVSQEQHRMNRGDTLMLSHTGPASPEPIQTDGSQDARLLLCELWQGNV